MHNTQATQSLRKTLFGSLISGVFTLMLISLLNPLLGKSAAQVMAVPTSAWLGVAALALVRKEVFGGAPTLILTADRDIEVVDQARAQFQAMANRLPHVTYHEFNSEAHDFLSFEDKERRDEALGGLKLIQDIFKGVVHNRHRMASIDGG